MGLLYLGYLSLVLGGTLLLMQIGKVEFTPIQKKAVIVSLGITTILFTAWDVWAVSQKHWAFGWNHTLGIPILNQPLEEILFFILIPFFGLVVYHSLNSRRIKK